VEALVTPALTQHAPFDELEPETLRFLVKRLALAYYPRGSVIAAPERGPADRLYIVKQGSVRGGDGATPAASDIVFGAGECFPIAALVAGHPVGHAYSAEQDSFCWELAAADFESLMRLSERWRRFCTDRLAALVERSQRILRIEAGEALIDGASMLAPLRSALRRAPVACPPSAPLAEVLAAMRDERVGSVVIADAARAPLGILTTTDMLERVVLAQASMDTPISRLMTPGPVRLEEDATLADAALAMARHGIRHVVVTRDGRLVGVVSERDLFALQRVSLRRTSERIRGARDVAGLAEAAADIRGLARQLLAHGVGAQQLTEMVSALNDALAQRLIAICAARHSLPERWCWIALGSEGRMEQTLVSDQDNALLFAAEGDPEPARRALLPFADEVNRALDACGYPLCKGDIMARNPRWCLSEAEWRAVFGGWIRNSSPEALLNASIFFDFRSLAGEASLAGSLRDAVLGEARSRPAFLRMLAEAALQSGPPLGLLQDFAQDPLDLKAGGARLFTDAARVLALAAGSGETGTATRLRAAGADAFHFIQGLRLRHGANRVAVAALGAVDRRVLKESLRQAAALQRRLKLDYGL
jgi:CBS domain-containing protein